MSNMIRKELIQRLLEFDEEVNLMYDNDIKWRIIIVGGGALVITEMLSRSTHDIDVIDAPSHLVDLMADYDINTRVQSYINNFPYNYEDRIKRLEIKSKSIEFYTASLEDIVIAKLYSVRPKDKSDITDPVVLSNLDWDLLHRLATSDDEAAASKMNEFRYQEFLNDFYEFERRYRPCGN